MNFDIRAVHMLTAIAAELQAHHPSHTPQQQLLNNVSLLDAQVKEYQFDWKSAAVIADVTRDKIYHWYIETHLRQMNGDQLQGIDRKNMRTEIETAILNRQIEDPLFQSSLKSKLFQNRTIIQSDFKMAYNNIVRSKRIEQLIKINNITLPNRKLSRNDQSQSDIESFSQSRSERASLSSHSSKKQSDFIPESIRNSEQQCGPISAQQSLDQLNLTTAVFETKQMSQEFNHDFENFDIKDIFGSGKLSGSKSADNLTNVCKQNKIFDPLTKVNVSTAKQDSSKDRSKENQVKEKSTQHLTDFNNDSIQSVLHIISSGSSVQKTRSITVSQQQSKMELVTEQDGCEGDYGQ